MKRKLFPRPDLLADVVIQITALLAVLIVIVWTGVILFKMVVGWQ